MAFSAAAAARARGSKAPTFWGSDQLRCYLFSLTVVLSVSSVFSTSSAIVRTLPGFSGPLPFKLETGYVSVGDSDDSELFYFFVESQGNPQKDPLLLYMVGGPYCSGLNPFFYQTGPIMFNTTNYSDGFPTLCLREDDWTKVASIIYIDQPAGAGFSYSKNPNNNRGSDTKSARDTHEFMRKWLHGHQEFINNEFYIVGESYSGITAPMIVQEILNGNKIGLEPQINLAGYIDSSPITDRALEEDKRIPEAYYMGLVTKELYESAVRSCREEYANVDPSNVDCLKDVNAISKCWSGINHWYVIGPRCQTLNPLIKPNVQGRRFLSRSSSNSTKPVFDCELDCYSYQAGVWGNDQIVRSALNVDKGAGRFYRCNYILREENYDMNVMGVVDYHQNLTNTNLRVLVYSGDLDLLVPHISTEAWISSLNLDVVDGWRQWIVDDQVAGYTMKYGKSGYSLTYATVKGAGHPPTEYKRHECYNMFKRWIRGDPL